MNPFIHFCTKLSQVACFCLYISKCSPLLHSLNTQLVKCSHGKIYKAHVSSLVWPWLVNLRDRKTTTLENICPSGGFPHPSWEPQDKGHTTSSKNKNLHDYLCSSLRLTIILTSRVQKLTPPVQNVSSAATEGLHMSPFAKPYSRVAVGWRGPAAGLRRILPPFRFLKVLIL